MKIKTLRDETLHENLVTGLRAYDSAIRVGGFREAIELAVWGEEGVEDLKGLCGIPDAYQICQSESSITAFEVEVHCHLSDRRLKRYLELWDMLDFWSWELTLVLVDKFGEWHEWSSNRAWHEWAGGLGTR